MIMVAEGAGQDLMDGDPLETDASGNRRFGNIGEFLKDKITDFFKSRRIELNLKYIDPSYTIRSVPPRPAALLSPCILMTSNPVPCCRT